MSENSDRVHIPRRGKYAPIAKLEPRIVKEGGDTPKAMVALFIFAFIMMIIGAGAMVYALVHVLVYGMPAPSQ